MRENKFGIAHDEALQVYRQAAQLPGIRVTGVDGHIGLQITEVSPFLAAIDKLLELVDTLRPRPASHSNTSTWAAGSASATRTSSRRRAPACSRRIRARLDAHPIARNLGAEA